MLELVEKENAFTLTLTDRLHNPYLTNSLELFNEKTVVSWQVVCGWQEIKMGSFVVFTFPLKLLFVALQILDHQIFPR